MRKTILAATIILLAGCAAQETYWVHTHNSQQRALQDQLDCEQQALRMYPRLLINQQITPPTQTRGTISCSVFGSTITCDEFGGRSDPGLSIPMDANNRLRGEAIATCLRTKGYQLISNEQIDRANAANRPTPQNQDLIRSVPQMPELRREVSLSDGSKVCEYSNGATKVFPRNEQCDRYLKNATNYTPQRPELIREVSFSDGRKKCDYSNGTAITLPKNKQCDQFF